MVYKFKEIRLDLERDTIDVVVSFQESRNRWRLKHYTYDVMDEELDINDLIHRTKNIIDGTTL